MRSRQSPNALHPMSQGRDQGTGSATRETAKEIGMTDHREKSEPPVRLAQCAMNCGSTRPSDPGLPFFWWKPDQPYDTYYDGCLPGIGWD
jgi:hypothetical protein